MTRKSIRIVAIIVQLKTIQHYCVPIVVPDGQKINILRIAMAFSVVVISLRIFSTRIRKTTTTVVLLPSNSGENPSCTI